MDKHVRLAKQNKSKGLGARLLLAAMGGLAAMVAGVENRYHADRSTESKFKRSRYAGRHKPAGHKPMSTGKVKITNVMHAFDSKGIVWSSKPNRQRSHSSQMVR